VLPQYEFTEVQQQKHLPAAHLISHGTAFGGTMTASPRGEAFWALPRQKFFFTNNSIKEFFICVKAEF
jgi:hypothetical protein